MLQQLCHSRATSLYVGWKQPLLSTISSLDLAATISRRCPPFTETIFAFLAVDSKVVVPCRVVLWFNAVGITFWIWWPWRNQAVAVILYQRCSSGKMMMYRCDTVVVIVLRWRFFGKDDDVERASLWYCCFDADSHSGDGRHIVTSSCEQGEVLLQCNYYYKCNSI